MNALREGQIAWALAKALSALGCRFPTAMAMMQWQPAVAVAVVVIAIITTITVITQQRSLLLLSALPFRLFAWVLALFFLVPEPLSVEESELLVLSAPRISTPCLPLDLNSKLHAAVSPVPLELSATPKVAWGIMRLWSH